MKKSLRFLMTAVMLFAFTSLCTAQEKSYKEFMKERKEISKFTKEQAKEKASKDARKAAKQLQKEGWKVAPGGLPIERQLDRIYEMQYEIDLETGFPKYIKGEAMSTGGNYDAAKMQAVNLAIIELAGNISTEVAALIDNRVTNKQLDPEEAVSATESVMAATSFIKQNIGRTIIALELYRDLKNKNKEVRVVVMYNSDMAKAAAKDAIREEMNKKSDKLADRLEEILGF